MDACFALSPTRRYGSDGRRRQLGEQLCQAALEHGSNFPEHHIGGKKMSSVIQGSEEANQEASGGFRR
jgi:hypothetical protein